MKKQIRLDKYLCEVSGASRSEVKNWMKKGRISVNGQVEKDPGRKVDAQADQVCLEGRVLSYSSFHYVMLHKPAGVVSATQDNLDKTVLDLVLEQDWPEESFGKAVYQKLFPVGRLDKDTEGLLLMTDDGDLSHQLLSPKKHVEKTYFALLDGPVGEKEEEAFAHGLDIGDDKLTMPAKLCSATPAETKDQTPKGKSGFGVWITIQEGRFHQVKRMAKAVGREVLYLKRFSMGSLTLDPQLKAGECRLLTREEVEDLRHSRSEK